MQPFSDSDALEFELHTYVSDSFRIQKPDALIFIYIYFVYIYILNFLFLLYFLF